jgi:hypothetical protein
MLMSAERYREEGYLLLALLCTIFAIYCLYFVS